MQVSQRVPALLAVLSLAAPLARPLASQGGRYRVSVDNAWFYQDVAGRRIARLASGAVLSGGATRNDWIQITLEGWIFSTSVGPSDRPDFDLLVTKTPNENLRGAPAGPLVAELAQGFGLKRATAPDSSGRWVHVQRQGWVQLSALAPIADVVATRTTDTTTTDTTHVRQAPGPIPQAPTPVDSTRAQPMRVTTLYRAPDGPEAGTVATDTPLRVLSRNGEWTRVQFEGWVKGGDLQAAPAGVQVGVTAAELRAEPQRYVGQVLRWNLEFIAIQKADELRPDIPSGSSYVLARGRARPKRPQPLSRQPDRRSDFAGGRSNAVNDVLNERIRRKLDVMPDEQAYQVLDYIEFLESKYSQRAAGAPAFQKVAETLEDTMRAGRVPVTIIKGTMDAVGKAGRFFEGVVAAGKAAVEEAKKKQVEETKPPQ